MPLIHTLTQVINLFVARCPSYKKNKTKYAQSKIRSSLFIEKVGFLFLNEVYCLVFLFLCHHWFLLRQFVNLYISPVPPYWTLLLLVGNTDCVNLLHCSLWPLNIVANKLRQNIDCVSLSRFVGAATLGQTLQWDFRVEIGFSLSIVSYLLLLLWATGEVLTEVVLLRLNKEKKRKEILLHAVFKCFGILVAHLHIEIKLLHSHPIVTFVFFVLPETPRLFTFQRLFSSS